MAVDTFVVFVGVYANDEDAEADYALVKDLHVEEGLLDAYDAAVITKRDNGKVKIAKKHETPTRVGGVLGGGIGLATGLVIAIFPFAGIGAAALAGTAGGALLGAVAGHAAAGMSRHDLKELGEDPTSGRPIVAKDGRFGTYVTDGEYNATLRKDDDLETLTHERAVELLAERRAKGPATGKKTTKKAAAKKA